MAGSRSKEYQLAIKIAGQVSSSFNSAMGDAKSKITSLGTIAKQAAAATAAAWGALQIGQFISGAADTYMGFEQSMAQTAATAGATSEQYDALRQAALEMGKATSKTAAESADALGYMALAGWSVEDSIASLEPVLRLSEATQMDLARCSDLVTDSMSALGLEVSDLSGYLDVAAQANNKSNQTAEMLMEAYIGVGGTMKNLNVPIQQSAAALGVMANRGIKGGEAGNALNAVMINLTTGAGQAGKMMGKLGISAFDSSGKFIGLQETIQKVYEATKDMTEAERNAALAAIGGKQHTDALNALMSGLTTTTAEGVTEWNALADSLYNSKGAMADMAATVTDTWQGAKARLDSAIDDLKINLVSVFAPYAKDAINSVAEHLPKITAAATAAAQSFITYALPHIAAFKDRAIELFSMASSGIGKVVSGHSATFDKLGELASRIGAFFADLKVNGEPVLDFIAGTALPAIVDGALNLVDRLADLGIFLTEHKALVLAIIAAYAGFKGLTALSNLGGKITAATKTLEAFQQVTKGTSLVTSALNGKLPAISAAFRVLTGKIKLTELATEAAKGKLSAFTGGFKAIGSLGKTAFSGLKSGVLALGGALKGIGASIMSFMATNPVGWVVIAITAVIGAVVLLYNKCEWFRNAVHAVINAVAGFFQNLWSGIQGVWQAVSEWFQTNVIQPLINFFSPIIETVSGIFRGCWIIIQALWIIVSSWFQNNVITPLVSFFSDAIQMVSGFFSWLWSGIQGVWQSVAGWFQTNVITPLVNFFSPIVEGISAFFSELWTNIVSIWQAVGAWFQDHVATPINNAFQIVNYFVRGIFNGLLGFIEGMLNNVIHTINTFIGGFSGVVGKAASFIGVEWDGIAMIPEVSLPRMAEGGIVNQPTVLEAGEAGTEAIVPLSELWGQMHSLIEDSMKSNVIPITDLLDELRGNRDNPPPQDGGNGQPPIVIYYQPQYHFEGEAPSREDLVAAGKMTQEEFDRMARQWLKDIERKKLA